MRGLWHPSGCSTFFSGSSSANWSQMGSMMHDGMAGMGSAPCSESLGNFPTGLAESMSPLQAGAHLPTGGASKYVMRKKEGSGQRRRADLLVRGTGFGARRSRKGALRRRKGEARHQSSGAHATP